VVAAVIGRALPIAIRHLVAPPAWPPAVRRRAALTGSGHEVADVRTVTVAAIRNIDRSAA
jgi:hypothetical protein